MGSGVDWPQRGAGAAPLRLAKASEIRHRAVFFLLRCCFERPISFSTDAVGGYGFVALPARFGFPCFMGSGLSGAFQRWAVLSLGFGMREGFRAFLLGSLTSGFFFSEEGMRRRRCVWCWFPKGA